MRQKFTLNLCPTCFITGATAIAFGGQALLSDTDMLGDTGMALIDAGWDLEHISCEDYFFSDGKVLIDGGNGKRAGRGNKTDYQLCYPDINSPLAVVDDGNALIVSRSYRIVSKVIRDTNVF